MSNNQPPIETQAEEAKFQPDMYYFPVQVAVELSDIQGNILGKVLTIIDALGLNPKQEKSIKDLIRTVVKEQMITSRRLLQGRLDTVLNLGIKDDGSRQYFSFDHGYVVTPIYHEEDMGDPLPPPR